MDKLTIDPVVEEVLARALAGDEIGRTDAITLLERVRTGSLEMGLLCAAADRLSRERTGNLGEVFSQTGINCGHCTLECDFCVLKAVEGEVRMDRDDVVERQLVFIAEGANTVSLMVTADYPFEEYLEMARAVRAAIPPAYPLVANVGDFDEVQAREMVDAGLTAVYHVIRLREGVDTKLDPDTRKRTLLAARTAGMDVTYCLEPIGPEHSLEELVEGIMRGKEFEPTSMATMRRIAVPGTPLGSRGQIPEVEQARLCAVTALVAWSWPNTMMVSAHEPSKQLLRAGANRVTAEAGVNPRDTSRETSRSRGYSVAACRELLVDTGWDLREGPSPVMQGPLRGKCPPVAAVA